MKIDKNLILRSVTGVAFVAVMVGCMLHPYAYAALFAVITGLATWEFCTIVNKNMGLQVNRMITTLSGVYLFAAILLYVVGLSDAKVFIPYLISILYLLVSELYVRKDFSVLDWAFAMMAQLYVALPFAMLNVLSMIGTAQGVVYNWAYPLSVFIFLWANDSGAYCVGSTIGKRRLFPSISPKKSWEGSIGGGIVAIVASQILATFVPFVDDIDLKSRLLWAGLAVVVVVFGTWGDLVESLLKRRLGIKDSGNILPGHGGMLDRFDSALLAIPAAVVYVYTVSIPW